MFITSLLTLGGVSVMFGVGVVVKNGSEILSNLEIEMDKKKIKLGKEKKEKGGFNDDSIAHLRKESKSRAQV